MKWVEVPCNLYACSEQNDMLNDMGIHTETEEIKSCAMIDLDEVESFNPDSKTETMMHFKSSAYFVINLSYNDVKKLFVEVQ